MLFSLRKCNVKHFCGLSPNVSDPWHCFKKYDRGREGDDDNVFMISMNYVTLSWCFYRILVDTGSILIFQI